MKILFFIFKELVAKMLNWIFFLLKHFPKNNFDFIGRILGYIKYNS